MPSVISKKATTTKIKKARRPQKPPKPPTYPWKVRDNPDLRDIIFADKKEFKEKWLEWNRCLVGNEENFLSTISYSAAWVRCYMGRNPIITHAPAWKR
jgi:hypothetical protein